MSGSSTPSSLSTETYSDVDTVTDTGTDGLRYVHVQAKDLAGNESDPPTKASVTIDGTAPAIESITDTTAATDGKYRAGEDIELTVRFDEDGHGGGNSSTEFWQWALGQLYQQLPVI